MAKYIIDEATLTGLGDAIRDVTGETSTYTPEEMTTKVRSMQMSAGGTVDIPVFDLGAMGLPAITLPNGYSMWEGDPADIVAALDKGAVGFVIPIEDNGDQTYISIKVFGSVIESGQYMCETSILTDTIIYFNVSVIPGAGIAVAVTTLNALIDFYIDEALGGDY